MKMQKRKFRIGQLAKFIGVERFVVRFWEKEFQLRTLRSDGGQRFYDENDLETFQLIKQLLYERGFTINGAKKQLNSTKRKVEKEATVLSKTYITPAQLSETKKVKVLEEQNKELSKRVSHLQEQLLKLRELL